MLESIAGNTSMLMGKASEASVASHVRKSIHDALPLQKLEFPRQPQKLDYKRFAWSALARLQAKRGRRPLEGGGRGPGYASSACVARV